MKQQDILDRTIERALARDAQELPTFSTTPSSALTAKLAISVASKGLLGTLTAKLLLIVGIAAVSATAWYVIPSSKTVEPALRQHSQQIATPAKVDSSRHAIAPVTGRKMPHVHKAHPVVFVPVSTEAKIPSMKDTTAIPRIQKSNYEPPLK